MKFIVLPKLTAIGRSGSGDIGCERIYQGIENKKSLIKIRLFQILTSRDYYFALSAGAAAESVAIVEAESVAIVVVSVDIVAVESVVVSSVFGLLWQAANVSMLPTNSRANTFFIPFSDFLGFDCKYSFFLTNPKQQSVNLCLADITRRIIPFGIGFIEELPLISIVVLPLV
ncbi:hypothetical protein [Spirosoma aerophilum]